MQIHCCAATWGDFDELKNSYCQANTVLSQLCSVFIHIHKNDFNVCTEVSVEVKSMLPYVLGFHF